MFIILINSFITSCNIYRSLFGCSVLNLDSMKVTPMTKRTMRMPVMLTIMASALYWLYFLLLQIAFSRWPRRAAAAARTRMAEPRYWWRGSTRARMSAENLGNRKARNPSTH